MGTLLVGFDSAWTKRKSGAIAAVLLHENGTFQEFGPPRCVNYDEAKHLVKSLKCSAKPTATIILLDQPTIVPNAIGQRPVENIVSSPVSARHGGMQPANTSRIDMFGKEAPLWHFLSHFGGPADPRHSTAEIRVVETYPVLAMIALRWMLPDTRLKGRLPKYNPDRRNTYSAADWRHVCTLLADEFRQRSLLELACWLDSAKINPKPRKREQDGVDACVCLLVALYLAERKECLFVGDQETGYIVVPYDAELAAELIARCIDTGRVPADWIQRFQMHVS